MESTENKSKSKKTTDETKILEAYSRVITIINIDLSVIEKEQESSRFIKKHQRYEYKQLCPSSYRKILGYSKLILEIKKELRELQSSIDVSTMTDEELKNLINDTANIVELERKKK